MQVGPGGSDQGEAEGGEARLALREAQQRTAQTNLVTVASPPISSQHRSRPFPFLSHTLLRAPFIPPPNAHVSPVLPALKHPGTSRCSPDKTQPPQSHGQPLAVWSSSLHPALDSCHAGVPPPAPPPTSLPAPGNCPPPAASCRGPAVGVALLVTAHADLRWVRWRCRRLPRVGTRFSACRNGLWPGDTQQIANLTLGPARLFSPSVSAN